MPAEQQGNVERMGRLFTERFSAMEGVSVVGSIEDFLYRDGDCYDTVYHLLTEPARRCTAVWCRDLKAQLRADGLWDEPPLFYTQGRPIASLQDRKGNEVDGAFAVKLEIQRPDAFLREKDAARFAGCAVCVNGNTA